MIRVLSQQSLFDIAIQEAGGAEAAFEIALLNGLSLTDDLSPGEEIKTSEVFEKSIKSYYTNKGLKPATASNVNITKEEGIEIWAIEDDFIVS